MALLRSAAGAWFLVPATAGCQPCGYIQTMQTELESQLALYSTAHWWRRLGATAPYALVSYVALRYGQEPRFARAVGSACRLLLPTARPGWALVMLPSGQLRFIDNAVFALPGPLQPVNKRFFETPNAGHNRRLGWRPVVRGTARNPNDHPHGGRTGSIKYPRTP